MPMPSFCLNLDEPCRQHSVDTRNGPCQSSPKRGEVVCAEEHMLHYCGRRSASPGGCSARRRSLSSCVDRASSTCVHAGSCRDERFPSCLCFVLLCHCAVGKEDVRCLVEGYWQRRLGVLGG
ncbi:hypothetical protein BD310DRAFT_919958 [Dichomitus squalens]|uniref:Uncharacterized protein n=1 Tax=Dichomitus squalens TaxID=114155 RepID=A0A4Q9Q5E4_9APHY|nr:hypothetical protein BD310DRAFT_919958 [Dichomitus squalens]